MQAKDVGGGQGGVKGRLGAFAFHLLSLYRYRVRSEGTGALVLARAKGRSRNTRNASGSLDFVRRDSVRETGIFQWILEQFFC